MFDPASYDEHPPTAALARFIKRRDWPGARCRLLTYPSDAKYRPRHGNQVTPLHLCCLYRAPIDVINLILDANPSAILTQDSAGWTPIHLVIVHGLPKNVAILLIRRGGVTAAALQSPFAGSPLHLACLHGSPIDILEELINSNAKMATVPNEKGAKPAEVVWFHFQKNPANKQFVEIVREDRRKRAKKEIVTRNSMVDDLFERLRLLVEGVKHDGDRVPSAHRSPSLLWDIVTNEQALGSLSEFLEIAVLIFPEQLEVQEEISGNFVLHLAASYPPVPASSSSVKRQMEGGCPKDTIDILVEAFPTPASLRNNNGDFPIHLALTKGRRSWRNGIKSLVEAHSEPLQHCDSRTGLYPFQLAAAFPCGKSEEESLETIFQLLLACPHVVTCS